MKVRNFFIVIFILLPAVLASGCLDDEEEGKGVKFHDPLGNEVVLEGLPERIITLSPALTETVFALGIGGRIVATDNVSNYPDEAVHLPKVFSYMGLFTEELIVSEPDLVLLDKTLDINEDAYNTIKSLGIPVYRIYPRTLEDVLEAIIGIGNITGSSMKAAEIVEGFRSRMDDIEEALMDLPEESRPGVLLVTYYDEGSDPWVSTDSTMAGGLVKKAGGTNIISDGTGIVVQVPVEKVIGADPDIIICTQSTVWPTESRNTILADDRWKDISAVRENRVYDIDGDLVDRTGPRLIEGLEEIHERVLEFIGE
ncbi:MAG: ABC transporter substrate-binding protein [Thermoplasmatota archaeon]